MPITLGDTSITSSTGKVGIGSGFTPATGLHAQSSTVEADRSLRLAFDATFFSEIRQLGAGGMGFRNNSVDNLMAIDGSGRVTMPFQPIISGQMGTALISPTAEQKLAFDQFWVSRGITYNSSTRRFTVPVAGIYQITLNPFFNTAIPAGRVLVGVNTDVPTVNNNHFGHAYRESAQYETGCIISVVSLSANDYIVYYLAAGGLYNQSTDRFNQFSITLIA